MIRLQWSRDSIDPHCLSVEEVGEHSHPWGMAEEDRPIYLCCGLHAPLARQWASLKHWN